MLRYILRRILILPFTLFGLSILIFGLLQLLDPIERASLYITSPPRTASAMQDIIARYNLDAPFYVQYWDWISKVVRLDLGWSKSAGTPVLEAVGRFFPATFELALWSFVPIMTLGVTLGVKAAVRQNRLADQLARLFSIVGYAFPSFLFGLLLLLIFYANLQWFPPGRLSDWATAAINSGGYNTITGMNTIDSLINGRLDIFLDALRHLLLPAATLSYVNIALVLRVTRSSMLDVLRAEYVTVARSKGLPEEHVIRRHARPNAMIPVATIGGLLFAGLLNGAVLSETVFNYRGIGWWAANAAGSLDAISVLGVTLLGGTLLIVANLGVDILYAVLDPRIRLE
ncbi:MAG TPA: ABC transporter permease [Chloroflexia bacterium]|nr:ABC transporter permease [Chloroflexia bacterium]